MKSRNSFLQSEINWHIAALVLITLIAAWLRFKDLTFQSYWLDEMASLYLAQPRNTILEVLSSALRDNTTPLYQLILWAWFKLFGFSEYSGRSLSAVTGVFGVVAIYYLGKEYINNSAGIYAAIIASSNQYLIYYSQEARSYQLLFLLTALCLLFVSRLLRLKNTATLVFYTVLCVCLVQTHYYGILAYLALVSLLVFYGYIRNPFDTTVRKYLWLNFFVVIASLLPAFPYLVKNFMRKSFWINEPAHDFYIDYFVEYFADKELAILFAVLCLSGLVYLIRTPDSRQKNILYLALAFLVFVYLVPYIRSVISTPMLTSKYTIGILPVLILVVCSGIRFVCNKKTGALLVVLLFVLSTGVIFLKNDYYHEVRKEQYREALQIIAGPARKDSHNKAVVFCYHNRGLKVYAAMLGYDLDIRRNSSDALENADMNAFWFIARGNTRDEWENMVDDKFRFISKDNIRLVKDIQMQGIRLLQYEVVSG